MSEDVAGRHALVTGGAQGIGRMITERLWRAGVHVTATYHTGAVAAAELTRATGASQNPVTTVPADLAGPDGPRALLEQLADRASAAPTVLVHCAGGASKRTLEELTYPDWQRAFDLHVWSGFALAQGLADGMRAQRWGRIVFVSSAAVYTGGTLGAHYTASKAAQIGLMHHLARVLGPHGVTANAIAPSGIPTAITTPGGIDRHLADAVLTRPGTADEAAHVVEMLVRNGFVTGQTVRVDGGVRLD